MQKKTPKEKMKEFQSELTQEEKDAHSYLDWSDEKLGKFTRLTAENLVTKTIKGYESVAVMSAFFILASLTESCNAGDLTMELSNVTSELHPIPTDWKFTVKKIEKKSKKNRKLKA